MAKLTEQETRRYAPQIKLPEIGVEGQELLKDKKVMVIGAGGLGTPLMQYLNAAGIGTLGIADDDLIDIQNLQRQVLFGIKDLGKLKTVISREKLQAQNHMVNIDVVNIRISEHNILKTIDDCDLIIDATDNYATRFLIDDACHVLGKPWIFGSIYKFEGQLSVFNYRGGPSLRCLFSAVPSEMERFNTEHSGILGVMPGLIGCYQAIEALKVLLDFGDPLSGKLLIYNALTNRQQILHFQGTHQEQPDRYFS